LKAGNHRLKSVAVQLQLQVVEMAELCNWNQFDDGEQGINAQFPT